MIFERTEALLDDLRAFAADPSIAAIPFSFPSHQRGSSLLQLAAGRTPASLESRSPSTLDFQAAQRFLAYVAFDSKNDYFTLLCVDRNAPDEAIKDNYRRLIALVHPDANPIGFPADAASRVNLGYAVLSNSEARASYAESLDRILTDSAFAIKDHPGEANGARGSPKAQRSSPPRRLFAWIKRPRFGFGLLALATILIVPVVVILANMAKDTGGERLISSREKSEQSERKQAASNAESIAVSSTRSTNAPEPSNIAAVTESSVPLQPPKSSSRSDYPIRAVSIPVDATERTQAPRSAPEKGALAISNGGYSLAATTEFATNPPSMRLSLAPVPSRSLDPTEPASTVSDTRPPRVTAPQTAPPALVDAGQRNSNNAPATTPGTVTAQPSAVAQNQSAAVPRAMDARGRDSEDALLRFGSAYEQGSIESVRALFASAMPGRSQMIANYQRVFFNTRQRSIRFLQLKHTVAGQRVTTVGEAVVNTIGTDNKSSSQRVFLEIEVARDGNDVRIERMSNYALD